MKQVSASDVERHIESFWPTNAKRYVTWRLGAGARRLPDLRICEVAPAAEGEPWVYVTSGASECVHPARGERSEFVIVAAAADAAHVETLAMACTFHVDPKYGVPYGHILTIGRSWLPSSRCDHLLVSKPYYQGPDFEWCDLAEPPIRFLWLTPITAAEAHFAREHGQEALEARLESMQADVVYANRPSVVEKVN